MMDSLDSLEGVKQDGFVKNEDGSLKNFMIMIGGESFRCECGCNCFHKPIDEPNRFICNACDAEYVAK
jgi:hypothetical protein